MYINNKVIIGKSGNEELSILLNKINRHGIISGATGTGKTVTVKVLAESFSDAGIPVFLADVKGDLGGCCDLGVTDEISERLQMLNLTNFDVKKFPVRFWDIYGEYGHPIKSTISNIGPSILSIMLGLTEVQEGVLNIVFKIAEDENKALTDLKDLRSMLSYVYDNNKEYNVKYGNISSQSIGVIQRSLLTLEQQGADKFFKEPSLEIKDILSYDMNDGRGNINILHASKLFQNPDLYASMLLWLLTYLFENMPEVGDLDKPKLAFFFDEAHLLFNDMPSYRLKKITQMVKLIRSRGIGLYFISQSPLDIPDEILSQLGNKVQHALRAYTPAEQKKVKAIADSFRANPEFDTYDTIMNLGTGEALISFQNENGEPEVVKKAIILPPQSKLGTIDDITRNKVINNSSIVGKYEVEVDNESAFEIIKEIEENEEKEKQEEIKIKEEKLKEKENERIKKEEEKKLKNSVGYKLGKKVTNKAVDKAINKGLNSLFKNLFK